MGRAASALGLLLAPALAALAPVLASPLPAPRPAVAPDPPAAAVPLPVPRPEAAGPSLPAPRAVEAFGPPLPPRPADPLAPPEPDATCGPLLATGKVAGHRVEPIPGRDGCGIAAPVLLEAVILRSGRRAVLSPPAVMRCDFADSFADWLRDAVVPATAAEGDLLGVDDAAAYVCRQRNWQAGGRISEHARGNAIDLLAFHFARRTVGLKGAGDAALLAVLKSTACSRFSTVLGPGADAFHETDLHLDLLRRAHGFRLCQWDVP